MHKDLSGKEREHLEANARVEARWMQDHNQSLAIAREAWINAFDAAAKELDNA